MEEGKHLQRLEKHWQEQKGQPPPPVDTMASLLEEMHRLAPVREAAAKALGLKGAPLARLIAEPTFRKAVDAEIDEELASRLEESLSIERGEAEHALVRLSIVTHILTPALGALATRA